MDHVPPAVRRRIMSRIHGTDTQPEMTVRRLVHSLGLRYRLHCRDLPGTPDLVFPRWKCVLFVHGCFWHQHTCPRGRRPTTNVDFWNDKLEANMRRDRRNIASLKALEWSVLVVWECQIKDAAALTVRIRKFFATH